MHSNDRPIRVTLRIPADLHQKLTESASNNNRSMNAEIVHMIEHYIEETDLLESQYSEWQMQSTPPSGSDPMKKLEREFTKAQSELFVKLAAKHGIPLLRASDFSEENE